MLFGLHFRRSLPILVLFRMLASVLPRLVDRCLDVEYMLVVSVEPPVTKFRGLLGLKWGLFHLLVPGQEVSSMRTSLGC